LPFVTLDNKNWCKGIYHKGSLEFGEIPETISRTWRYAPYLEGKNIEYAALYAQGKTLDEVCPPSLQEEWQKQTKRLNAYHKSFVHAKVNLNDNCFFDLVPYQFLKDFCEVKCKIIDQVIESKTKPENYDFLLELDKFSSQIADQELNVHVEKLKDSLYDVRARNLYNKILKISKKVEYNIFGSKTGRLTTKKDTFPILNLDSKYRSILEPKNDVFVELDFNAAEVRTLLALSEQDQPKEDIHSWNAKKFNITREEAKQEIFAWLYGSSKVDSSKYEKFFNLDKIKEKFYNGVNVKNMYGRIIPSDDFHYLNYVIQSTTSDVVLRQVLKLSQELKNKKSFIAFTVHDSVVIDLAKEERNLINILIEIFSNTDLGRFPVNVSAGKDYGTLRTI